MSQLRILVAAIALIGASGLIPADASALTGGSGPSGWSIRFPPRPASAPFSELNAVSCPSDRRCISVGDFTKRDGTTLGLAEAWNGVGWRIVTPPTPGDYFGSLGAVSCTSWRWCMSVGYYQKASGPGRGLAEIWNGSRWRVSPVRQPAGSSDTSLLAVSCASPGSCLAAGSTAGLHGVTKMLTERWNGTRWRILVSARPGGIPAQSVISGISCASSRACMAAGYYHPRDGATLPLAEYWNGVTWHIQKLPIRAGSRGALLSAVSCTAPAACTAIGYADGHVRTTFAERWNGRHWSLQATPIPPRSGRTNAVVSLNSLSCRSASSCVAIGSWHGRRLLTYALSWNGQRWVVQPIANPAKASESVLQGVSCAKALCVAVGALSREPGQMTPWAAIARR